MSYFLLKDEYQVSEEKTYLWYDLGGAGAISKEWNYLWNVFLGVSKEWTFLWDIHAFVVREFTYLWSIGGYISRELSYLWEIGLGFGGKVKYHFLKAKEKTRFFWGDRRG